MRLAAGPAMVAPFGIPGASGDILIQILDEDVAAKVLPDVLAVVRLPEAVAVVAERWEVALAARDRLVVEWSNQSPFRSAESEADLRQDMEAATALDRPDVAWESRGDAPGTLASAPRIIEATYSTEYVYHAQMEPLAAVAAVDEDGKGAEIWLGTQSRPSRSILRRRCWAPRRTASASTRCRWAAPSAGASSSRGNCCATPCCSRAR
jgi:xanthine dehydrogenase molybdopterin-binding subunit B